MVGGIYVTIDLSVWRKCSLYEQLFCPDEFLSIFFYNVIILGHKFAKVNLLWDTNIISGELEATE